MFTIKKIQSFEEVKDSWLELEKNVLSSPFQTFWYQELFAKNFIEKKNIYILQITDNSKIIALIPFEKNNDKLLLIGMKPIFGDKEITDYGDLIIDQKILDNKDTLQTIWELIIKSVRPDGIREIQIDYVREDNPLFFLFDKYEKKVQQIAPILYLPSSWNEYLAKLDRKNRHELRRKIRRLETKKYSLSFPENLSQENYNQFVRLHRMSKQSKNDFMTDQMKDFFWQAATATKEIWPMKICQLDIDNQPAASAVYYQNHNQIMLYNSGYDPEYNYYSVGLLLVAFLIKKSIEDGFITFDFLRGDERYKYDLGGKDVRLYQIKLKVKS